MAGIHLLAVLILIQPVKAAVIYETSCVCSRITIFPIPCVSKSSRFSMSSSTSVSVSTSASTSVSTSVSPSTSTSASTSVSPSTSTSISAGASVSTSVSPSTTTPVSVSPSVSTSVSTTGSASRSIAPLTSTLVNMPSIVSTNISVSAGTKSIVLVTASVSTSTSVPPSVSASAITSASVSASASTSASVSPSVSASASTSASVSPCVSSSASTSASVSPSVSPSVSVTATTSPSVSPSVSTSSSASMSVGPSTSTLVSMQSSSVSTSVSKRVSSSTSVSASPSASVSTSASPSKSTSVSMSSCTSTDVSTTVVCHCYAPSRPPLIPVPVTPPGTVVEMVLVIRRACPLEGNYNASKDALFLFYCIKIEIMKLFTWDSVVYVVKVDFVFASCVDGVLVLIRIKVTFRVNLPPYVIIEQKLKEGIRNNFGNLNVTNNYTLTFQGANVVYQAKSGECQKCCNAGGPIALLESCTPASNCEGFLPKEKTESGHCPGEGRDTCQSVICDKGYSVHSPSFAVLALMTLLSLFRIIVC